MLKQRGRYIRDHWLEEGVGLGGAQQLAFQERDHLVQHAGVIRAGDIAGCSERQPHAVVGNPGSHALPGMRQPPVLDVAFDKLPSGGAQQVPSRGVGTGKGERHMVLQLVAESVGAACLVEGRARPDAAG
ncbi:hypothetical protein D3C72_1835220 [compost metagenome]